MPLRHRLFALPLLAACGCGDPGGGDAASCFSQDELRATPWACTSSDTVLDLGGSGVEVESPEDAADLLSGVTCISNGTVTLSSVAVVGQFFPAMQRADGLRFGMEKGARADLFPNLTAARELTLRGGENSSLVGLNSLVAVDALSLGAIPETSGSLAALRDVRILTVGSEGNPPVSLAALGGVQRVEYLGAHEVAVEALSELSSIECIGELDLRQGSGDSGPALPSLRRAGVIRIWDSDELTHLGFLANLETVWERVRVTHNDALSADETSALVSAAADGAKITVAGNLGDVLDDDGPCEFANDGWCDEPVAASCELVSEWHSCDAICPLGSDTNDHCSFDPED